MAVTTELYGMCMFAQACTARIYVADYAGTELVMAGSSRYHPKTYIYMALMDSTPNELIGPFHLEQWNDGATGT